jgi:hypothetical protein
VKTVIYFVFVVVRTKGHTDATRLINVSIPAILVMIISKSGRDVVIRAYSGYFYHLGGLADLHEVPATLEIICTLDRRMRTILVLNVGALDVL